MLRHGTGLSGRLSRTPTTTWTPQIQAKFNQGYPTASCSPRTPRHGRAVPESGRLEGHAWWTCPGTWCELISASSASGRGLRNCHEIEEFIANARQQFKADLNETVLENTAGHRSAAEAEDQQCPSYAAPPPACDFLDLCRKSITSGLRDARRRQVAGDDAAATAWPF